MSNGSLMKQKKMLKQGRLDDDEKKALNVDHNDGTKQKRFACLIFHQII